MIPGKESQTAVMVCQARALADGRTIAEFSDPVALQLLPVEDRGVVERARAGLEPSGADDATRRAFLDRRVDMIVARTVEIDEAIRASAAAQVVILGAGLDGRAWRMAELHDRVVFEVDHPDSQREKRARAAVLPPAAREIHFVPVDFTRDSLDDALAHAGHDATRPTIWVWEGVIMYLTLAEAEATLRIIAARSATTSRLVIAYVSELPAGAEVLRQAGEPVRALFTAPEMAQLLAAHGFTVTRDRTAAEIGASYGGELARRTSWVNQLRIVVADRQG